MNMIFKKPYYNEDEINCVKDALLYGTDYLSLAKSRLAEDYGENIFLTSSGSSAFDLLFCALGLEKDSEIIMPSYTFPSAANTLLRAGLLPVFADIDESTKALDINDVLLKISPKTKCVITTHYGACSTDMDKLKSACGDILIIEDAALSFGAKYKNKALGAIGDMGILSFHSTKNISAEEGGMLVVGPKHKSLIQSIQTVYDNGTNKHDFKAGRVESYSWQRAGMNAGLSNINAAVLFAQLNKSREILKKQEEIYKYYQKHLEELSSYIELPYTPKYTDNNYHVFYIMLKDVECREKVRKYLISKGISAYIHYVPLHCSEMGKKLGYRPDDLPVSKSVGERILRLPIYAGMELSDCGKVISALKEVLCKK